MPSAQVEGHECDIVISTKDLSPMIYICTVIGSHVTLTMNSKNQKPALHFASFTLSILAFHLRSLLASSLSLFQFRN